MYAKYRSNSNNLATEVVPPLNLVGDCLRASDTTKCESSGNGDEQNLIAETVVSRFSN